MLNLPKTNTPRPATREGMVAIYVTLDGVISAVDHTGAPVNVVPSGISFAGPEIFNISGTGPYTLANTPRGGLLIVAADGFQLHPTEHFTRSGSAITLTSAVAAAYQQLAVTYSY